MRRRQILFQKMSEPMESLTCNVTISGKTIFDEYVKGKMATIQYSILSSLNVPQQPKFVCIRDDPDEILSTLLV